MSTLLAAGPSPEIPAEAAIYTPLIGSWDAVVADHETDGTIRQNRAEVHFAWVLEGRAIQDVWISPPRNERTQNTPRPNRYGTTLRVFDAKKGIWRITWLNPVTGVETRLVGRKEDSDIVQEGRMDESGARIRWSFRGMTADSFHWVGEESTDEGTTWRVRTEFFARRRHTYSSEAR